MFRPTRRSCRDLSDVERALLAPLLPLAKTGERPRKWPPRLICDGILYVLVIGCRWQLLTRDFPLWQTIYHCCRESRLDGTWEWFHTRLSERGRAQHGRQPQPNAGIFDRQSVKMTCVGGERGYDGSKRLSGRKRHLLVNVLRLVLRAKVKLADFQDRPVASSSTTGTNEAFPRLEQL